jgi:hypothetical protein
MCEGRVGHLLVPVGRALYCCLCVCRHALPKCDSQSVAAARGKPRASSSLFSAQTPLCELRQLVNNTLLIVSIGKT